MDKEQKEHSASRRSFSLLTPSKLETSALEKYHFPSRRFCNEDQVLEHIGYKLKDKLGSGGYGTVYKVVRLNDSATFALKKIDLKTRSYTKMERYFKNKLYSLLKCKHPNVIEVKDSFFINLDAYIVMEYANGGSLSRIAKKKPQPESIVRKIIIQVLHGLLFLHENNIAHRDLKLDNILFVYVDGTCTAKITDFGLSKLVFHQEHSYIEPGNYAGTKTYMSPEIVKIRVHPELGGLDIHSKQFPADVWALGVCLFELLTTHCPFESSSEMVMLRKQENREYSFPSSCKLSSSCQHFIAQIFEPDPVRRIDSFGLLTHDWILQEIRETS